MPDATHRSREVEGSERGRLIALPVGDRRASPPNNLPLELSSFVGREGELAQVQRLLGDVRLLTLTGTGGSGKTRLAVAVAGELSGRFEDGVWMAELAPLSDPSLVPQAVASTLGVRERLGRTPLETLADHLRTKEMLLVLDNCERLIGACAQLADTLLRSCPDLRVLATSREALGVGGEVAWPVPPLALPDLGRLPDVEGLPRYESVRLFVDRAEAVKPAFALTAQNAGAVAQLCYRLDGIPLAIELAAARTKVLSVEEIAARLGDSFGLLSAGSRTAMPRHQTLRATMDWSHELLSEEERALLRRLSVFAGGFSLEAAESVCAGEEPERDGVLDLLSRLVDKSLVIAREEGGETRYRLLETVRRYAEEKLDGAGDGAELRGRHAAFFVGFAERAHPEVLGERQAEWLERLEREYGNLRAAMSWALDAGDGATGARMGWALWHFWWVRGHHREGRGWMEAVLRCALPPASRGRALVVAGTVAFSHGDYGRCEAYSEEGLELSRRVGDELGAAWARVGLGVVAMSRTDHEAATPPLEEALRSFRELDELFGVARVTTCLGMVALMRGDEGRATTMFEHGLAAAHRIGDGTTTYITLYSLALLAISRSDYDDAANLFEKGIAVSEQVGDRANVAYCVRGLAAVAGAREQAQRCARLFGAAERILEDAGSPVYSYYMPDRHLYERTLTAARSQLEEAAWDAAWAEGGAMVHERAVEYALEHELAPEPAPSESHPAGLSAREAEVLRLVARGMTNAKVAEKLFLSSRTVNWHLTSIYRKLEIHSRTEATRFAAEHGLL